MGESPFLVSGGRMDEDLFRQLPPEHERAVRLMSDLASSPQNREVVETAVAWDVRRELLAGGYAETVRFDPFEERYPCFYQDGYDHYRLTPKGRAYFELRKRNIFWKLVRYVLPAVIAFFGALIGAFIGTAG